MQLCNPLSKVRLAWNIALTLLILFTVIVVPFQVTFGSGSNTFLDYCKVFILIFLFADVILSLFTGYFSDGILVTGSKKNA